VIDILVTGSVIYTGSDVIRDGYILIKGGRIYSVGSMPVPEEFTYATLILGGPGRIVVPGLTALTDILAYPIRFKATSMAERIKFYRSVPREHLVRMALPAIYEAHTSGITSIIIEGIDPATVLSIRDLVGGLYGLAKPSCSDTGITGERIPGLITLVRVSDESCRGEGVNIGSDDILSLVSRPTYTLYGVKNTYARSSRLRELLGIEPQGIREGIIAEVVVYNVSRPPGMLLEYTDIDVIREIYSIGSRVESLIIGDQVLVDGHEHLYIVEKDFNEARKISERYVGGGRHLGV